MNKAHDCFAADFLSHYTAHKLQNGGEPVITADELNYAANDFMHSIYRGKTTAIDHFCFDDLAAIAQVWQDRATRQAPDAKAGFRVDGDRLLPTYDFHNISGNTAKVLTAHFAHAPLLVMKPTPTVRKPVTKATRVAATAAANYLTDYLAKAYIESERKVGHWPCHLTDLHHLYREDLGRHLHLRGDKKYFAKFRDAATDYLAQLITNAPDGVVRLSDQVDGTLAYNNWCHLTKGFALLDGLRPRDAQQLPVLRTRLLIRPDTVRVTEQRLRNGKDYQSHRIDLTPASIMTAQAKNKLRKLTLGEQIYAIRRAAELFTDQRER